MEEIPVFTHNDIKFDLKFKVVKTKTLPPKKNLKNRDSEETRILRTRILNQLDKLDINQQITLSGASATRELANSLVTSFNNSIDEKKKLTVHTLNNNLIGIWRVK